MVVPGSLNIGIVRGIQFDGLILQCRDENVDVTSGDFPNVVGKYVPNGQFGGYDLFILAGSPGWFLYFNALAGTYVIAQSLTTGSLSNYFLSDVPLTEPSGSYTGQGTFAGSTADADDHPADLTGLAAEALVRRTNNPGAEVVLDFDPSITDTVNGVVVIPAISKADTEDLRLGHFDWDLVFRSILSGERFGPFAKGSVVISDNITSTLIPT